MMSSFDSGIWCRLLSLKAIIIVYSNTFVTYHQLNQFLKQFFLRKLLS